MAWLRLWRICKMVAAAKLPQISRTRTGTARRRWRVIQREVPAAARSKGWEKTPDAIAMPPTDSLVQYQAARIASHAPLINY